MSGPIATLDSGRISGNCRTQFGTNPSAFPPLPDFLAPIVPLACPIERNLVLPVDILSTYGHLYGRVPSQWPVGYRSIDTVTAEPPEAPADFDPLDGATPFKMDGNGPDPTLTVNGGTPVGDCGFCMTVSANLVTSGAVKVPFKDPSANTVVTDYLKYDKGQDIGVQNSQLLPYWRKTGLWGSKIAGYGSVNFHDFDEAMAYAHAFYGVCLGIAVSEAMEIATQNGEPWDYTGSAQDDNILGGHDVYVFGRKSGLGILATWGQRQLFTERWWKHYAEECDAVVTNELVKAKPSLVDVSKLDTYLNGIAA